LASAQEKNQCLEGGVLIVVIARLKPRKQQWQLSTVLLLQGGVR